MAASWQQFEAEAPQLAKLGKSLLINGRRAFLATVRRDGSPRVHPICPTLLDGRLLAVVIRRSPKCQDLFRDGRYALHSMPGPGDAEFWVSGIARPLDRKRRMDDGAVEEHLVAMGGDRDDAIFELQLGTALGTVFSMDRSGHPIPDRRRWACPPEPTEMIR